LRGVVTAAPATPGATSPTAAATPASRPAARSRGLVVPYRFPGGPLGEGER